MKKVFKKVFMLLVFTSLTFLSLSSLVSASGDLTKSGIVDSIQVNPLDLNDGERTTIIVTFSEKKNITIKSDDTITLKLPNEDNANLTGFYKKMDLYGAGKVKLGSVEIKEESVVVTFNKEAEHLDNVAGSFSFEALARNFRGEEQEENIAILATDFGTQLEKQNISIKKTAAGENSVFYYKTGDMQTYDINNIRWFLLVNNEMKEVDGGIKIIDEVQNGHELLINSFRIQVTGPKEGTYTVEEFNNQGIGKLTFSGNSFEINIDQHASFNSFYFNYNTKVVNEKIKAFENYTQAWYKSKDGIDISNGDQFDASVDNVSFDADIDGDTPPVNSFKIIKTLDTDKTPLHGINFNLYYEDGRFIDKLTTDSKGIATYEGLRYGKYYVTEINDANHLQIDDSIKYEFDINDSLNEGITLNITNSVKTTDITANKVWVGGPAIKPDIELILLQDNQPYLEPVLLTDNKTSYTWKDLPQYNYKGKKHVYRVDEKTTDSSFSKSISADGLTITNTYNQIKITGTKIWENAPKIKPTISLELLQNGKQFKKVASLSNTQTSFTWTNLPAYDKNGQEYKYTVNEVDSLKDVTKKSSTDGLTITNTYNPISVTGSKVWVGGPTIKPDVVMVLKQNGQSIKDPITLTNNETSFTWTDLLKYDENGDEYLYTIDELTSSSDYTKSISADGLTITNTYNPVEITGTKVWVGGPTIKPDAKLILLQNNVQYKEPIVLSDGTTNYTWTNLDKYDKFGNLYEYSVDEIDVHSDYTKSISQDGLTITNTIKPIDIIGTKVWKGGPKTKPTIKLILLQNNKQFGQEIILENNETSYTWSDLPKYDLDGNLYEYTLDEIDVPSGYFKTISSDGFTITNTIISRGDDKKPAKPKPVKPIIKKPIVKDEPLNKDNDDMTGFLPNTGSNYGFFTAISLLLLSISTGIIIKKQY